MRRSKTRKRPYSVLEKENLDLRDALNDIADILEEVGILEPGEEIAEDEEEPEYVLVPVEEDPTASLPSKQDKDQHHPDNHASD